MASGTIKSVVPRSDIVNDLTTNDSTKVLSAAQGKALKDIADTLNTKVNNVYNKTFSMGANNTITITRATQHQNYIITASSTSHDQVFIVASNGGIANLGSYGAAAWSNNDETLTIVINTYRGVTIQSDNTINYTLSTTSGTFTDGSNWKPYGKLAVTNWNNQTVANIKSGLIALNNTMADGEMRQIKFVASAASGVIRANDHYVGFIRRYVGTHFYVDASEAYRNENLILEYANGTWIENVIPAEINNKVTNLERDPVVIVEFNGTTATSVNLAINADNFRLLAFLIYDSNGQIVNSAVAPPLGFRNVTAKIYGESNSQWGSMLLASDYASATLNRTTATTTKIRLYGIY